MPGILRGSVQAVEADRGDRGLTKKGEETTRLGLFGERDGEMIYLYGGILGGYVTLWLVSWREKGKGPFQRMAAYLLRKREGRQQKQAGRRKNWQRDMYRRQLGE